ncbi:MAG: NAD(P)/FAD-dependent oxidoreductase [Deltaproteobacteria bacterium]|nr:NAD(P)/FAD-dependent oxidoreductase [Deltaproteobacteria bacterium]
MAKTYDLIVIGAGPAGLMAAKTAGENGLTVALLERKDSITDINRACTMMLLVLNEYIFGERITYNTRDGRISFPVNGFSIRYDGPRKNLYGWQFYSPKGECISFGNYKEGEAKGSEGRISVVFDKSSLLRCLLEDCEQHKAEVFSGTNVVEIEKKDDKVCIKSKEGKSFEGRFIIAADGTNSLVAKKLGFNEERRFYATLSGFGWDLLGSEMEEAMSLKTWVGEEKPTIFLFSIPRAYSDEFAVIGGGFNPHIDYERQVDNFLSQGRFSSWFKNVEKVRSVAFCENVYSPIREPYRDNTLLIGDAAWCQEVEITGAILCGWKAANAVTVALADNKINREGIESYIDWWKMSLADRHDFRDYLRPFTMPVLMSNEDIDFLFNAVKGPLKPTLHAFTGGEILSAEIQKLVPMLQKKKPRLFEKIVKFGTTPLEALLEEGMRTGYPNKQ